MISTRISNVLTAFFLFLAFAMVCAVVITVWISLGIVLHWLVPGIDLGLATMICSLAFVFVISVIFVAAKTLITASVHDAEEQDEEQDEQFDEEDEEEKWEREQTRHWNQKIPSRRRAQRRRSRYK